MLGTVQDCGWQVRQIVVGQEGGGCMVVNTRARSTYIVSRGLVPRLRRSGIWTWSTCSVQAKRPCKSETLDRNCYGFFLLNDLLDKLLQVIVIVTWYLSIHSNTKRSRHLLFRAAVFRMCRWNRILMRCVVP